jgi:hypothetical protein
MSTTGNEFEQPGVNYPDRRDADGAEATPGPGEPTRGAETDMPIVGGDPYHEDQGEQVADPHMHQQPTDEPSHQAVGIGVSEHPGVATDAESRRSEDHHGQDEGRDTLTVSGAQKADGGLGSEQEQRLPAMSQNDAPAVDKVAGIVAQTRADVGTESLERIAEVLGQRLSQSGVELPESDVHELARQVHTGDAESPAQS